MVQQSHQPPSPRHGRFGRNRNTRKKRKFSSVEHLSPEAVAAFCDDELVDSAAHRARVHLVHCADCRKEIHRQRGASELLRGLNSSEKLRAPRDLVARLSRISDVVNGSGPNATDAPMPQPEDFMDKVETFLRAFRRIHGR